MSRSSGNDPPRTRKAFMPPNHSATTSTASTQKDMASTFDVHRCWEPVLFLPTIPHVRSTQVCSPRGGELAQFDPSCEPFRREHASNRPHGDPAEGHQVGRSHSPPPDFTRVTTISTMAGDQGRLRNLKSPEYRRCGFARGIRRRTHTHRPSQYSGQRLRSASTADLRK